MKQLKNLLLGSAIFTCQTIANDAIRTELSFTQDTEGNLNPELFIPFYYGSDEKFFSGVGYSSKNFKEVENITGFSDSKNALISEQKELRLSYINYQLPYQNFTLSLGIESRFFAIKNNEFGYIHDAGDVFGNGSDYYIAFDNEVELDIQRHSIHADITMPFGTFVNSRFGASIAPLSSLKVKQNTLFKPLVNNNASSSSTTSQNLAYMLNFELQTNTTSFADIVFFGSYDYQPIEYTIAQLDYDGTNYLFKDATIETNEITTRLGAKIVFDYEILTLLRPSIGYISEKLTRENEIQNRSTTTTTSLFSIGFEKRF